MDCVARPVVVYHLGQEGGKLRREKSAVRRRKKIGQAHWKWTEEMVKIWMLYGASTLLGLWGEG